MSEDLIITFPHGLQTAVLTQPAREHAQEEYLASPWVGLYYKKDFQTREQFSPSQIETARGCERAWGYRYIWGLRTLEAPPNTDLTKLKGRDRSLAFGKAMHREGETYYTTGCFDETTLPGRSFLAGLHLLPHPKDCEQIEVELGISLDIKRLQAGIEPVSFVGFKDLVTRYDRKWFLFDYKSTRDFQWMKTEAQLVDDLAAGLYSLDIMQREGLSELPGRYVYFKSEGRPQAKATDVRWHLNQAKDVVNSGIITALHLRQHLRARTMPSELDSNPSHCKAYGGCPYRKSAGGPCDGEYTGVFLLGTALANMTPPNKGNTTMPEADQLPGESDVTYKIRQARTRAALANAGQAPAVAQPQPGFAPAPPGFMVQPGQVAPAPFPLPAGVAQVPVVSHVLPPESAQAPMQAPIVPEPAQVVYQPPPAPVLAPPASYVPPPPPLVAPPVTETTAEPAKRKGRPPGSKNVKPAPGTTLTPGQLVSYTSTSVVIELGDATITIESPSESDAGGLAELIQGVLA